MEDYQADNIQSLGFQEAIRLRPRLYFSKWFEAGSMDAFALEFLCHALDEYFDGNCTRIALNLHESGLHIRYDAGISLEETTGGISKAACILTVAMACSNEKKHRAVGDEFCEIGIAALNAASISCSLKTVSNYRKGKLEFAYGKTVSVQIEACSESEEYTEFTIVPDYQLFEGLKLSVEGIRLKAAALQNKLPGLSITVNE